MRARIVGVTALLTGVMLVSGIAIAGTAVEVLNTPRNDFMGSAEDGYLAFAQSRVGKPNKTDVYLKPPGEAKFKVNVAGTTAFYPNVEIGDVTHGDRLVFAQRVSGNTNVKIWDVDGGQFVNTPAAINSAAIESKPSISGDHLFFGRGPDEGGGYMTRLFLYDFVADVTQPIARAPRNGIIFPGTVNGDWLSWTQCSPTDCRAFRHQISTDNDQEVPTTGRLVYTSAVGQDGVVWYMQSGIGCGANVKLRRHEVGVGAATIIDFADGIDGNVSDLDDTDPKNRQLYFDRVRCSNLNNWAIWRASPD
jgi:hypothetical protein